MIPRDADYIISAYKNKLLVLETWHRGDASRDIEISAYRERIKLGEIDYIVVTNRNSPFGSYRIP